MRRGSAGLTLISRAVRGRAVFGHSPSQMRTAAVILLMLTMRAAATPTPPLAPEIPAQLKPSDLANFEKRDVMIPMRDGVKLHTVILVPKGAKHAPILLTRTPYNASKRAGKGDL